MSNIIKAEEPVSTGVMPLILKDLNVIGKSFAGSGKKKNEFVSDTSNYQSANNFKPGDGFSFKIDRGEREKEKRQNVDAYLEVVKVKAMNIEKEAYLAGLERGRVATSEEVKRETADLISSLKNSLLEVSRLKENIYTESKDEIMDLIFLIAKKVIHREIEVDEETINDVIKSCVKRLTSKDEIVVLLNPQDLKTVSKFQVDLKQIDTDIKKVVLKEDSSVTRGGCVIETNFGSVDARIEPQIEEIEKALRSSVSAKK